MIHYVYLSVILILSVIIVLLIRYLRRLKATLPGPVSEDAEACVLNEQDERFLVKAVSVVESNISDPSFGVDEFAKEMAMSRSNLYVKLKDLTEEAPLDFIRRLRFERACKLLEDGRYSVAEISEKVGFNSSSYFTVSFRKYFGCLPTEYIKSRNR